MCRLMAYMGSPILLAHVVLWPDRSIIRQSYDARERLSNPALPQHLRLGNLNGDGFGIGWFSEKPEADCEDFPCVFTSVTPAWNNDNLTRLASKITSPLIFAHVRAAYPGMPVSEQNCHPFQWGRYLWMHNGNVGGFAQIRRPLLNLLSDAAYNAVPSFHSDSAIAFALFLHFLPHLEQKLTPSALLTAMEQTIAAIVEFEKEFKVEEVSLLNFVVSDGSTMVATRYVYPIGRQAATLYYAEGNAFQRKAKTEQNGVYELTYAEQGSGVAFIASEPITGSPSDWVAVPKNHALIISREKSGFVNIMQSPLSEEGRNLRQNEVSGCLEAVSRGIDVSARTWSEKPQHSLPFLHSSSSDEVVTVDRPDDQITGQQAAVLCLAVDKLRNNLYGSLTDGTIRVWNLQSQQLTYTLKAHEDPVLKIVLNDKYLYSTGGHRLRIWDLDTHKCVHSAVMQPGEGTLRALTVSPGSVYVGGQDSKVKLFTVKPEVFHTDCVEEEIVWSEQSAMNIGHLSAVHCLAICGKYICSAGGDSAIRVWNLQDFALVKVLHGHRGSVLTCKGYGSILMSGGRDNTVRVWDLEAFLSRRTLTGHKNDILKIDLLCPGSLGWDEEKLHSKLRRTLSIVSGGGPCLVASASADCTVRLWSMANWACVRILNLIREDHPAFSPLDQVASPTGVVSSPLAKTPALTRSEAIRYFTPLSLVLTKKRVYAGTRGGNVFIWDIEELVKTMDHSSEVDGSNGMLAHGSLEISLAMMRSESESALGEEVKEASTRSIIEMELLDRLSEFIRIQTISADTLRREDCFKGAKFLAKQLEGLGAEVKLATCFEDKNPVVIGRLGQDPSRPTVTFYGHYDVQPANEIDWKTEPFEVNARDGYLYARGVSDNKGPILAFIYAVKEIIETKSLIFEKDPLPINIAFLFEGEEENGSLGTLEAVKENLHWFKNNVLTVVSNTQWVGENLPCLTYGMRGMISLDISVFGPRNDLHSGNDGGVCNEPMVDLVKLLATLVDSHSDICVPGFYDDVSTDLLDAAWDGLESCNEFSPEGYQEAVGIPGLTVGESKMDILRARWCKPTLSVVDMRSDGGISIPAESTMDHYRFGPTRFSVIPCHAVGKVSIRFVPHQDKEKMISCLKNHVEHEFAKLRSKNCVAVKVVTSGDWWEAKTESKYFTLAKEAICKAWGNQPLTVREGGTMPLASSLEKLLGANALLIPMGQASDNCHLANERIRRLNLMKGKDVIRNLLESIATQL